jgi:hypothetical protein
MFGADRGRFAEIGDGAGDFQDSIVRAGGKAHAVDGHFESALAGIVEGADFADGAGGHPGVVESASLLQAAGALTRARISAEDSAAVLPRSSLKGTAGTST